jgi:hypothetical protein
VVSSFVKASRQVLSGRSSVSRPQVGIILHKKETVYLDSLFFYLLKLFIL